MQVKAQLNNLRIAPRKVRLLAGPLKNLNVARAKSHLEHLTKKAGRPLAKLLDSALANAHNNFGLVKENLYIKQVIVNEGPKLKRFRPKGFGMTSPIEKKTSHIGIILDERVPGMRIERPRAEIERRVEPSPEKTSVAQRKEQSRHRDVKPPAAETKQKGVFGGLKGMRRFFRRKAI
ncbi:MAG: 50S ribosomal protein L22 [Patescibacteria group bacterium]